MFLSIAAAAALRGETTIKLCVENDGRERESRYTAGRLAHRKSFKPTYTALLEKISIF